VGSHDQTFLVFTTLSHIYGHCPSFLQDYSKFSSSAGQQKQQQQPLDTFAGISAEITPFGASGCSMPTLSEDGEEDEEAAQVCPVRSRVLASDSALTSACLQTEAKQPLPPRCYRGLAPRSPKQLAKVTSQTGLRMYGARPSS
jgi:hypothetical protein